MKIQEIKISIKEKCFVNFNGLTNTERKGNLQRARDLFLNERGNEIQILESIEIENTDSDGKKNSKYSDSYSGYSVKYYEGELKIASEQNQSGVNMQVKLTKSIMDLVLKEAGGEIKEFVKKEYEEFENQLIQLIDKTQNKNIFGNFVVSKFKKLKETILKNANHTF
jgi:hypothetical protein